VIYYATVDGFCPFDSWFRELDDSKAVGIILNRLSRLRLGHFGQYRRIGPICELKIDYGPGFRVYFGVTSDQIVVLLGGTKRRQDQDIKAACVFWERSKL
jgi:putative addiction module killer protein